MYQSERSLEKKQHGEEGSIDLATECIMHSGPAGSMLMGNFSLRTAAAAAFMQAAPTAYMCVCSCHGLVRPDCTNVLVTGLCCCRCCFETNGLQAK